MSELVINVIGTPAPQGSKRAFVVNGRAVMAESSKKVKPWRQDVVAAIEAFISRDHIKVDGPDGGVAWGPELRSKLPLAMPLAVEVVFYIQRPQAHYGRRGGLPYLKDTAPRFVDKKPDVDKLLRATLDALTSSGLIRDDAQIADLRGVKRYADTATGARITVRPLDPSPACASSPVRAAGEAPPQEEVLFP